MAKDKIITFRVEMAEASSDGELENKGEANLHIQYNSLKELENTALHLPKLLAALVKEAKREIEEEEMRYPEKEIKQAFWDTYHKAGEVWFTDEEVTEGSWGEFLDNLNKLEEIPDLGRNLEGE